MSIEYIKHDRPVTEHDKAKFGKLADHDIVCPCLLIYELGEISDKNGTKVNVDKEFIEDLRSRTNQFIEDRASNPIAKDISTQYGDRALSEVLVIPLTKDHAPDVVDNQVGYSQGLAYTEKLSNGKLGLFIKVRVLNDHAKKDVISGLLRSISLGTRVDGSIKEISFVSNEAAPLCGLMLSEPSFFSKLIGKKRTMQLSAPEAGLQYQPESQPSPSEISKKRSKVVSKKIQLSEKISELQLAERNLEAKVIPNHYVLSRMIRQGKIKPFAYDDLIKKSTAELELMEKVIPGKAISTMYGTMKHPERLPESLIKEKQFAEAVEKSRNKLGLSKSNKSKIKEEIIHQAPPLEQMRRAELQRILELAEPESHVAKYLQFELGEEVEHPKYPDNTIKEYLAQLNSIKTELKSLTLQFEEN